MTRIRRIFTDPCVSVSTVAPVDVAHTYGSRHTWRSATYFIIFLLTDDTWNELRLPEFVRVRCWFFFHIRTQSRDWHCL